MALVPTHLLLLSSPCWPPQSDTIRTRYQDALATTLDYLSQEIRTNTVGTKLDIAVTVPGLAKGPAGKRGALYPAVQCLVAGIYRLICTIAAKRQINVEDAEGIDARIVLLVPDERNSGQAEPSAEPQLRLGPVVSLKTLVQSERRWRSVFVVEGEEGDRLLHDFTTSQEQRVKIQRVPIGEISNVNGAGSQEHQKAEAHTSIAVGGTWDHVHIGHKLLLTMFAFLAEPESSRRAVLTIGVTGDELLKNKKHAELLESWHERATSAQEFMSAIIDFRRPSDRFLKTQELFNTGPNGHVVLYEIGDKILLNIVEIADPFGPTITDPSITALVLSAETRSGGEAVNDKRSEAGWSDLEVFEVEVLDQGESQQADVGNNFESKLSSTAIRQKISTRGRLRSKA